MDGCAWPSKPSLLVLKGLKVLVRLDRFYKKIKVSFIYKRPLSFNVFEWSILKSWLKEVENYLSNAYFENLFSISETKLK